MPDERYVIDVLVQKSHAETAHREPPQKTAYSEHSIAFHSISMAGYVTAVLAFVCDKLHAQEASSFFDLFQLEMTYCNFTTFYSFLTSKGKHLFFGCAW